MHYIFLPLNQYWIYYMHHVTKSTGRCPSQAPTVAGYNYGHCNFIKISSNYHDFVNVKGARSRDFSNDTDMTQELVDFE